MKTILKPKDKLSRKMAINKIVAHSMFGSHGNSPRPKNTNEVEIFFRNAGIEPKELIQRTRNPMEPVPYMENLISSTWTVSGGKVEVVGSEGEVHASLDGEGQISTNSCQSLFETSVRARDRAINDSSYQYIFECLAFGFASIEAYFNNVANDWNKKNPDRILIDDQNNKVSLETKILEWIPILSGGRDFDKTNRQWSDFKALKRIRDQNAIHPNSPAQGMTFKEMASILNSYRHGIAHLLGNLHNLLGNIVPAVIINAIYYPDIEVCKVDDKANK